MKMKYFIFTLFAASLGLGQLTAYAQVKDGSIGGKEHDMNVYGVEIGMDVSTALQNVFVNAKRSPGQERPDAKKNEGKDNKDVRAVYKSLPDGELQILFADGKYVSEIVLRYAQVKRVAELRLPNSSGIGEVTSGERFDDRYTIGFVDNKKQEKVWWRDVKSAAGYQIRLLFLSGNLTKDTTQWWQTIVQKSIIVPKEDREAFIRSLSN